VRRLPVALLILAVLLVTLGGCGGEPAIALREWKVDSAAGTTKAITLPAKIDLPVSVESFVLHTDVALDEQLRGRTLTLVIPQIEARTTLVMFGRVLEPLDDPGHGWRGDRAPRWRIPSELTNVAKLPLTIVVSNGASPTTRWSTTPRLSATSFGDAKFRATRTLNHVSSAIALGALVGMFVTYFALYLLDRRKRAFGFLALAAILATSSPALWLEWTQHVFGRLELVFVAVMLAVAGLAILESMYDHFALPRPSQRWWFLAGTLVVMCAGSVIVPAAAGMTGILALLFNYAAIGWLGVVIARLYRRTPRPPDLPVMALAIGALFVSTLPAAAWRFGINHPFEGIVLTPIGMVLFLLIHSFSLSRAHVATLRTADALNVELAARIEQLDVLNVELRRQVADRSQKLADALARIEGVTSATRGLREGEVIDGRYRVLEPLGAGGMGAVYKVERISDGQHLALKNLRGETTGPAMSRFAREAEIAARIHHPNLVSVFDVDVAETGALYIVMELVDGTSLESVREKFGDPKWALPVLAQIAEGLAALHREHVIHRDLKPANVLLDRNGNVKIADFGIAALRDAIDPLGATSTPDQQAPKTPELTQTGALMGTPLYMAPELWRGADRANEATDMFGLGLVAYEMLASKYPWDAPPMYDVGAGRSIAAPPPVEGAPPAVAEIIARALSIDPSQRPTAAEFAAVISGR
jgi:hypothetical protein